jgi:hypothetical protein
MEIMNKHSWLILLLSISIYSQNTIKIDTLKFESSKFKTNNGLEFINQFLIYEDLCTDGGKLDKSYPRKKNQLQDREGLIGTIKDIKIGHRNLLKSSKQIRYSFYCNSSEVFNETTLIEICFSNQKEAIQWHKALEKNKLLKIKKQEREGHFVWENYNWLIISKDHVLYWLLIPTEDFDDRIRNIFEFTLNNIK